MPASSPCNRNTLFYTGQVYSTELPAKCKVWLVEAMRLFVIAKRVFDLVGWHEITIWLELCSLIIIWKASTSSIIRFNWNHPLPYPPQEALRYHNYSIQHSTPFSPLSHISIQDYQILYKENVVHTWPSSNTKSTKREENVPSMEIHADSHTNPEASCLSNPCSSLLLTTPEKKEGITSSRSCVITCTFHRVKMAGTLSRWGWEIWKRCTWWRCNQINHS